MWQVTATGSINGVKKGVEQVTAVMERQVTPAQSYSRYRKVKRTAALAIRSGVGLCGSDWRSITAVTVPHPS